MNYNETYHKILIFRNKKYYYNIFSLSIYDFYTDIMIMRDVVLELFLEKIIISNKKLSYMIWLIDEKIKLRKIENLYKRFPIGSYFYYNKLLCKVINICDNSSIFGFSDYSLDETYIITYNEKEKYETAIVSECVSKSELRLKKLKTIL